ncbi:GNAT family N-acetyltransferase [Kurthia gibsonii]|uniref:GNAT family N-acetyltransferase n=1 Tax=Kurthia gibsonii TaxID=33946 RepID=UPI0030197C31
MIRLFQEKNRQSLQQLFLEVRTKHFFWEDGASFELQDFDLQTQDEIILVAEDEKGILQGFLAIYEPDQFIHHLFIANDAQGKGIGKQLIDEAVKRFGTPLTLKCVSKNTAALQFYLKNNFYTVEEVDANPPYHLMRLE